MFGAPAADGTTYPASDYWLTTKSKVMKTDYTWELPNFAHQVAEGWTCIHGPVIYNASGTITNVNCKLHMVPDCNGYLCVEVKQWENARMCAVESKMQVYLSVCICDANDTKVSGVEFTEFPRHFVTVGTGRRWKLIRREVVLDNTQRYLSYGKLTVLCTLHYLQPETYTDAADQLNAPVPVVPPSEMGSCMGNALTDRLLCDVILVADEREFSAHRVILAQRSLVFRAMFGRDMAEKRDNRVVIKDLSADAVSDLLTFIYTDSAPNIKEVAPELLAAAEKYNIPRLKAVCEAELATNLDIDNVINRLIESEMYQASQLKDAALHWISKHAPDVVKTASWKPFCEQHPKLVTAICEQFASYVKVFI